MDYLGYQFWSNVSTVPTTLSDVITIAHQDVAITVNKVYGYDTEPLENIKVYLFTAAGSYQSLYETTNAEGQVTFCLPEQDYKVRADYLGTQYWSQAFNGQNETVDIDHGKVTLHVTYNGTDVGDTPVYLFSDTGSYLGRCERTDQDGTAIFTIPAKSCKFRVDYDGTQYWSNIVNVIASEETNIELPLDQLALNQTNDPTPKRYDGIPPKHERKPIMVASLGTLTGLLTNSIVAQTGNDAVYYVITDHLGTPQKLIDENNQVVWEADYKPFGEVNINVNTTINNFRFPGQYYDQETGLHYNWHRYYGPGIGRYLRGDPIGDGANLYIYSYNNSVNFMDPMGLCGKKEFEMRMWVGGGVGYVIIGGGIYNVTITDMSTGQSTLYTMKCIGMGVGLPSFRGSSRPVKFTTDASKRSESFEGFGYIGGVSAEAGVGIKVGGGNKIPNGPFIPGDMLSWDRGGFDIGVSHNLTYWSIDTD